MSERTRELVAASAKEARVLADSAEGVIRKRLLVLAHALDVAERELGTTTGVRLDGTALTRAVRAGEHDADLVAQAVALREVVRAELSPVHPGYDRSRGAS
ncbi:hypothetical protein AB0N05_34335 [Nocardia sp. NPDC051030]|uniref:hypothetical protein n=1 Tax=Nocardia sp. NPDC051030 TaxID=3155162 RepID=UPI0034451CD0